MDARTILHMKISLADRRIQELEAQGRREKNDPEYQAIVQYIIELKNEMFSLSRKEFEEENRQPGEFGTSP